MPFKDAEARRKYGREWRAARRAEFLVDASCVVCGSTEGLELHHRDPGSKAEHRIWTWSRPRIAAEVAKCDWLCGDCHDTHHAVERQAECGNNSSYRRGCRCDACRAAHTVANRRDRHKEVVNA